MPDHVSSLSIIIPTFNERDNIRPLVTRLEAALEGIAWDVIFVDDDSPDGTADEVLAVAAENPRARLIRRIGRRGLAGAVIEGMLSSVSPFLAVMDGDLQHDETRLRPMLERLMEDDGLDLVVASRHVNDGSASGGFSTLRSRGSNAATALARYALGFELSDPLSGFFMLRRSRFTEVVPELHSEGFKILADILAACGGRWRVEEIGYSFRPREVGESKMDIRVALEFLGLLVARPLGGLVSIRFVLFTGVGLTGVFVQLAALRLFMLLVNEEFMLAQSLAVMMAMTSNYFLNNLITYRDRALKGRALWQGLLSFYAVCSIGAVANVGVATAVFAALPSPELASLAGAVIGAAWNFLASAVVTWRAR